jgi:hypothetical protein
MTPLGQITMNIGINLWIASNGATLPFVLTAIVFADSSLASSLHRG